MLLSSCLVCGDFFCFVHGDKWVPKIVNKCSWKCETRTKCLNSMVLFEKNTMRIEHIIHGPQFHERFQIYFLSKNRRRFVCVIDISIIVFYECHFFAFFFIVEEKFPFQRLKILLYNFLKWVSVVNVDRPWEMHKTNPFMISWTAIMKLRIHVEIDKFHGPILAGHLKFVRDFNFMFLRMVKSRLLIQDILTCKYWFHNSLKKAY